MVTSTAPEFIDLTEHVESIIARSPVTEGLAVVFSRHTTAAITLNELEPLLLEDMAEFLDRLAPRVHAYRHNDFEVRTVNMTPDDAAFVEDGVPGAAKSWVGEHLSAGKEHGVTYSI